MAESLKAQGQETPAKVRSLTAEEKAANPAFEVLVIGGHRRLAGAKLAGMAALDCYILDIPPAETHRASLMDNNQEEMDWWDWDLAIEQEGKDTPGLSQEKLAKGLGVSPGKVQKALKITAVLTPTAREWVTRNLDENQASGDEIEAEPKNATKILKNDPSPRWMKNKGFLITESILLALADLGEPLMVERALKVVMDDYLSELETKKVVGWVQAGNEPEAFGQSNPPLTLPVSQTALIGKVPYVPSKPMPRGEGKGKKEQRSKGSPSPSAEASGDRQSAALQPAKAEPQAHETGTPLEQVRQKVRSGEEPTTKEHLAVAGHVAGVGAKWLWKWVSPLIKSFAKWVAKMAGKLVHYFAGIFKEAFSTVARPVLKWGMIFGLVLWGIWQLFHPAWVSWGFHRFILGPLTRFHHDSPPSTQSTVGISQSTGKPDTQTAIEPPRRQGRHEGLKPVTEKQNASESLPLKLVNPGAQPWNSDIEDRSYLEAEIAAVPGPGWIISFPFEPIPMSGDMSIRRLGDLQDQEKYSLIVGHDKRKVLSVSPAMTGFTLTYEDGLPIGGILGGPAKIDFYWEDVKAIHSDEIDSGGRKIYQFSLVVNGLKKPFIVQCPTKEGLSHLVSAFEFWIGAAGAGRKAPVTSMPYLFQGLWVNNESKVTAIWADSPASQAGLRFGDVIWSLGADAGQLQKNQDLVAGLQSLTPGQHDLYVVTPADWGDRVPIKDIRNVRAFKVKRRKMEIAVP